MPVHAAISLLNSPQELLHFPHSLFHSHQLPVTSPNFSSVDGTHLCPSPSTWSVQKLKWSWHVVALLVSQGISSLITRMLRHTYYRQSTPPAPWFWSPSRI